MLPEFKAFVQHTEKELFNLFRSIDRDQNGKIDKGELQAAFKKAGLAVPRSKLNQFFEEVDMNDDVCRYRSGVADILAVLTLFDRDISALTNGGNKRFSSCKCPVVTSIALPSCGTSTELHSS